MFQKRFLRGLKNKTGTIRPEPSEMRPQFTLVHIIPHKRTATNAGEGANPEVADPGGVVITQIITLVCPGSVFTMNKRFIAICPAMGTDHSFIIKLVPR